MAGCADAMIEVHGAQATVGADAHTDADAMAGVLGSALERVFKGAVHPFRARQLLTFA